MTRTWKTLAVAVALAAGAAVVKAEDQKTAQPAAPPAAAAAAPAPTPPAKPDPAGTATGTIADVPAKEAGKPTFGEVADAVGHNRVAINVMWTLLAGFLVMFMQAGFALVETGFTRAKNVAHTMMMNFMVYAIGMTGIRAADGWPGADRHAGRHGRARQRIHALALRQGLRPLRNEGILPGGLVL
jgi:hypothetical protein